MELICLTEENFKRLMKIAEDNLLSFISDYEYPGWNGSKSLDEKEFIEKLKREYL